MTYFVVADHIVANNQLVAWQMIRANLAMLLLEPKQTIEKCWRAVVATHTIVEAAATIVQFQLFGVIADIVAPSDSMSIVKPANLNQLLMMVQNFPIEALVVRPRLLAVVVPPPPLAECEMWLTVVHMKMVPLLQVPV